MITNEVRHAIVDPQEINTGHMDLTGRFPKSSSRRNECMLVGYHFDANYIRVASIKKIKGPTIA